MKSQRDIWIFTEKNTLLAELVGCANGLAKEMEANLTALILGPYSLARQAIALGVGQVFWLGEQRAGDMVEDCVPTLAKLVETHAPYAFLMGSTTRGRTIAGRLAARLDVTVLTDIKEIKWVDRYFQASHLIFGGGALRIEQTQVEPVIATVVPGTFLPGQADPNRQGEIVFVEWVPPTWQVGVRERKPRTATTVNLAAARKVVCLGRGVARKEDLAFLKDFANILGAEIGCTRPLAEGLNWLPRERYIGISGANIKPDLYLGVGVSGQVQHTVGMSDARVVVAINKDKDAPIFAQADFGIVGDLYTVVPALMAAIKAMK